MFKKDMTPLVYNNHITFALQFFLHLLKCQSVKIITIQAKSNTAVTVTYITGPYLNYFFLLIINALAYSITLFFFFFLLLQQQILGHH